MSSRLRLIPAALALTLPFALAACGSDDDGGDHGNHGASKAASDGPSVAASEDHNGADIAFATQMIPHHAQALVMTDMTAGRTLTPEFKKLVDGVLAAQGPEVNTMAGWLLEWGQPVPATARDHENAHGGSGSQAPTGASTDASAGPSQGQAEGQAEGPADHGDMPGMMSEEEMKQLADASDADFEKLWMELMIAHHEGAVEMAETQVKDGKYPAAKQLAQAIIDGQEAEIATMRKLIDAA